MIYMGDTIKEGVTDVQRLRSSIISLVVFPFLTTRSFYASKLKPKRRPEIIKPLSLRQNTPVLMLSVSQQTNDAK